jgi:signal transduction histidine kinase
MHPSSDDDDCLARANLARAGPAGTTAPDVDAIPSRAQLLEAADEGRRQLARDLHDGAQQRFVTAVLTLRRAQAEAQGTPAATLLGDALVQLEQGLVELRDLARGLHPAGLTEFGLAVALEVVAARASLPVVLRVTAERVPPAVESTIYFMVVEALTNVAKHARATHADVEVGVQDGVLEAEVRDNGAGGAKVDGGSGLRGLADRLKALDGTLSVESPAGGGTSLRAHVPLRPHLHAPR